MTDHAPFLRHIIAHPESDEARLRYADWLVDVGEDARAEFIRVQVGLAQSLAKYGSLLSLSTDPCGYDPPCPTCVQNTLRRRERELLDEKVNNVPQTIGPVSRLVALLRDLPNGLALRGYSFRRGFVEHVTLSWDDFRTHEAALRASTPLREVTLTDWPDASIDASGCYIPGMAQRLFILNSSPSISVTVITLDCLAAEFPGIMFNLPEWLPEYTVYTVRRQGASVSMPGLPFLESAARRQGSSHG